MWVTHTHDRPYTWHHVRTCYLKSMNVSRVKHYQWSSNCTVREDQDSSIGWNQMYPLNSFSKVQIVGSLHRRQSPIKAGQVHSILLTGMPCIPCITQYLYEFAYEQVEVYIKYSRDDDKHQEVLFDQGHKIQVELHVEVILISGRVQFSKRWTTRPSMWLSLSESARRSRIIIQAESRDWLTTWIEFTLCTPLHMVSAISSSPCSHCKVPMPGCLSLSVIFNKRSLCTRSIEGNTSWG